MVIRNPYGFIVKHYKLINFLLLIPMIYIALKFGDISDFFRSYVSYGYTTPETNFSQEYITILSIVIVSLTLAVNFIIYIILTTKKKSAIYHLSSSIYYLILFISLFFFYAAMSSIEIKTMDATFANFVRDCATIFSLPIYGFIIAGITKCLGFNIKTFRLDNNADLQISEEDQEDIEIKVGSDENKIKRGTIHLIRELKYYILENKFVFSCIGIVLLLIVGYSTYLNYQVYNKSYTINQAFSLNNFSLSLKDSYITNIDYRGNIISKDKYYLAIKIGIHNNGAATSIDKSNFRIYINNDEIYPSYDKSSRFIDIGKIYQGEIINNNEGHDYVFVYELTEKQIKNNYQMRILNDLRNDKGKLSKKYKKINIRPTNLLKKEELGEVSKNKVIDLQSTMLYNTKYALKRFDLVAGYQYNYEICDLNNCEEFKNTIVAQGGKALVVIEDKIGWDKTTSYYLNSEKDFYQDFATIEYSYQLSTGMNKVKTQTTTLKNVTPSALKDKKVYEVPGTLLDAKKINMILTIRNKKIIINIK